MKFKIGDQVRLKHLTEEDIEKSQLTYFSGMEENEGQTAVIEECDYRNKIYQIQFDGLHWAYEEHWLEPLVDYDAF